MCGIFALIQNIQNNEDIYDNDFVEKQFVLGKQRGPELSTLVRPSKEMYLGFHRLAINGLDSGSNQPFFIDSCYLICNGEIFNYKELYKQLDITPTTNSDCEVIIHLYRRYGIEYTANVIDGEFSFFLPAGF
jgi:asparagine synthase (glutamine-hydrolysing)